MKICAGQWACCKSLYSARLVHTYFKPIQDENILLTPAAGALVVIRYALKKKQRYYLGIFPKRRAPPPFWEPLIQKIFLVFILHFRT